MKKDINGNKNIFSNGEKLPHEFGSQPRKSDVRAHKSAQFVGNYVDEDDENVRHSHRSEPNKNRVRVQVRRIEQWY